jgi:penicillin-binding protein 1C
MMVEEPRSEFSEDEVLKNKPESAEQGDEDRQSTESEEIIKPLKSEVAGENPDREVDEGTNSPGETSIEEMNSVKAQSSEANSISTERANSEEIYPEENAEFEDSRSEQESEPVFRSNTAGGWYVPDEELEPPTQPVPINSSDHSEITGETQPTRPMEDLSTQKHTPQQAARVPSPAEMPGSLPRRVNEVDVDATRVTPAAYGGPAVRRVAAAVPRLDAQIPPRMSAPRAAETINWHRGLGCVLRLVIVGLFLFVVLAILGVSFLLFQYYRIAATLPPVDDLRQRAAQFETTRILDRNGNVLYEILDPSAGRRTYVSLDQISPYLVAATVATEDSGFYSHPGFDITAIGRAFLQNYQGGETVSGASTITQQLARSLLFSPEERVELTYMRKVREALLAAEITRRYSKDEILELYLNEIYYGNLAYGIEAAAQTYFRRPADQLTLAQAAFLAGLPQAPSVYDVYTSRDVTLRRLEQVLFLMYQTSQEQGCIYVSNSPQRVCIDAVAVADAGNELQEYQFPSPDIDIRYPHWVNYVRSLLEAQYDAQTIYRSGFSVYTTLDPGLQDLAEATVAKQVSTLTDHNARSGALVAIRPNTGEILAMVGSADFYNEAIDGQVNMAISPRQPGSSIKPLTYTAAFEKGWTPGTLIWDVPSEFPPSGDPNDTRPPYEPVNYDDRFHGPVTVRTALANSYNIPAVKTLSFVNIYDDPSTPAEDGFISFARRMGITTLTRDDYGLSLTLGGGEVTLLDLTGTYAVFANGGRRNPPVAITRIVDFNGNLVYEYSPNGGDQVIRPEHAYLITSILSDNEARSPAFGPDSVLNLPFQAAAKTGTTNDFRDNWTLGFTPELAVGVWIGNPDYTPMQNVSGVTGAAPAWADFMVEAIGRLAGGQPTLFVRPPGIVERVICSVSGTEPSGACPTQRTEIFAADQPPLPQGEDLWKRILIDTWTGLEASPACDKFTDEKQAINVSDPWAIRWLRNDPAGEAWADNYGFSEPLFFVPDRECTAEDPRPLLQFTSPGDGETITRNPLEIFGQAGATGDFESYRLEFGEGRDPVQWELLENEGIPINEPAKLFEWDLDSLPAGEVTLRLYLESTRDTYAELKLRLNLQVPTPTPTPTPTFTATPTATPTPTPTSTSTITPTPTVTPTPPNTPTPTGTPIDPFWTPQPTSGGF